MGNERYMSSYRTIRRQRTGTLVGVLLWAVWIAAISIVIGLSINNEQSSMFLSNQIFTWIIGGPLIVFIFAGRYFLNRDEITSHQTRSNRNNCILSIILFGAWAVINLICSALLITLSPMTNLAFGWLVGYLALVAYNRTWVY